MTKFTAKYLLQSPKLKTMPRGLGKLGMLKFLALWGLPELQEMPDLIGLTVMGSLKFECGSKLRALPWGLGELPCIFVTL